jgi:hypothetical protein
MARSSRCKKRFRSTTQIHKLMAHLNCARPSVTLRSHQRRDNDSEVPQAEGSTDISVADVSHRPKHACIALQNEDQADDIVVITKLDTVPFCCHEGLLAMSRDQLVAVAQSLNAKLPAAMQIDVSTYLPDIFIRHSVEHIVGLRRSVPPAPKAIKVQSDVDPIGFDLSPPSSPLATRTRRAYERTELSRLDEEDEEGTVMFRRPSKRRKLHIQDDGLPGDSLPILGNNAGEPPAGENLTFARRNTRRLADGKSTTARRKFDISQSRIPRHRSKAKREHENLFDLLSPSQANQHRQTKSRRGQHLKWTPRIPSTNFGTDESYDKEGSFPPSTPFTGMAGVKSVFASIDSN